MTAATRYVLKSVRHKVLFVARFKQFIPWDSADSASFRGCCPEPTPNHENVPQSIGHRTRRSAPPALLRRVRRSPRSRRTRHGLRTMLGPGVAAPRAAMRSLWPSDVRPELSVVRASAAVCARRAKCVLGIGRGRARHRPRAQVSRLVSCRGRDGGAHGASRLAGGCRR